MTHCVFSSFPHSAKVCHVSGALTDCLVDRPLIVHLLLPPCSHFCSHTCLPGTWWLSPQTAPQPPQTGARLSPVFPSHLPTSSQPLPAFQKRVEVSHSLANHDSILSPATGLFLLEFLYLHFGVRKANASISMKQMSWASFYRMLHSLLFCISVPILS